MYICTGTESRRQFIVRNGIACTYILLDSMPRYICMYVRVWNTLFHALMLPISVFVNPASSYVVNLHSVQKTVLYLKDRIFHRVRSRCVLRCGVLLACCVLRVVACCVIHTARYCAIRYATLCIALLCSALLCSAQFAFIQLSIQYCPVLSCPILSYSTHNTR
jgi:hypothetical protein